jgi:heme/copper-type cytochrome/quinol oxidase subunit 4
MMWVMISGFAEKMPVRVKWYVRENWGAPFIVGFMLLLMIVAVSLSIGVAVVANEVAVYTYYALVIGFVLQLVHFMKVSPKSGGKNNGSS